jgi:hypothetical protein
MVVGGIVMALLVCTTAGGEPVSVRYTEGIVHGFLALRSLDGKTLAEGDLIQTADGPLVTARVVFRFHDGSLQDETAVFSQRGQFRLVRDRLVQRGPAFPRALELTIDAAKGTATVTYADGKERKTETERFDPATDLANGMILTLLKNVRPAQPPKSFSYIAATPKPRLVKLVLQNAGQEPFSTVGSDRTATHFVLTVDVGGLTGVLAKLFGKQPPDSHVWILGGEAPAFVRSEQPFFVGGPLWRVELVSPTWPRGRGAAPPR